MSALARLWSLRGERPVFVACTLGVLAFFLAYPAVDWQLRAAGIASEFRFYDFGAYTGGVDRWLAGEPIYWQDDDGGYHGSYLYPPVYLLVFRPFTSLPFEQGAIAWNAFSVALLWIGLQFVVGACGYDLRAWERLGLLWLLLGFQPLLLSLKLAQTSAFTAGLLCLAFAALVRGERERSSRYASGVLTALGGTVKLAQAPVGTHLLADRDRLLGAVGGGLVLAAVSLLVFGVEAHLTYLDVLAWGKGWGDPGRSPQLWLPPYFRPFYVFGEASLWLRIGGVLLVATAALLAASGDADQETFALGLAAMPLLAPRADAYYFVLTLPAVVVLLAGELERDGHPLVPVVAVWLLGVHSYGLKLLVDLPSWSSLGAAIQPAVPVLQPGLWGTLLLAGLALVRVLERASLAWPPGLPDGRWLHRR